MSNLDNEELIATRILNGVDKSETAKEFIRLKRKAEYIDKLIDNRKELHEEARREFAKKHIMSTNTNDKINSFVLMYAEKSIIDELNFIKEKIKHV